MAVADGQTSVYYYEPESKGQSMEWKHANSPVKKYVLGAVVSKEGHADSLLENESTHNYFLKIC